MNAAHEYMMGDSSPENGDILEGSIKAYLDASGYVVAPKEPTASMMEAGHGDNHFGDHDPYGAYKRMITAFPSPFENKGG